MLIIEVDGFAETVDRQARIAKEFCETQGAFEIKLAQTEEEADRLWMARKIGSVALYRISKTMVTEDATVPISKIPAMVRKLNEIEKKVQNEYLSPGPCRRREHAPAHDL